MQAFIELLKANPWSLALFGGMALVIAVLVFIILRKDIKHLKEFVSAKLEPIQRDLRNHITETNGKIDKLSDRFDRLSDRLDRLCEAFLKDKEKK